MHDDAPSELLSRRHQMFPVLTDAEIARIRRFGTVRHYRRGENLFVAGQPGAGMFVVLQGVVAISQRDGLGHVVPIVHQGHGQFLAEVGRCRAGRRWSTVRPEKMLRHCSCRPGNCVP